MHLEWPLSTCAPESHGRGGRSPCPIALPLRPAFRGCASRAIFLLLCSCEFGGHHPRSGTFHITSPGTLPDRVQLLYSAPAPVAPTTFSSLLPMPVASRVLVGSWMALHTGLAMLPASPARDGSTPSRTKPAHATINTPRRSASLYVSSRTSLPWDLLAEPPRRPRPIHHVTCEKPLVFHGPPARTPTAELSEVYRLSKRSLPGQIAGLTVSSALGQ